jgi:beta-galactosidase
MSNITRRDVLKSSLLAGAAVLAPGSSRAMRDDTPGAATDAAPPAAVPADFAGRERLRLDADWRFNLGPEVDGTHGYAGGGSFEKQGNLFAPSSPRFDASAWHQVHLPHDWAVDLPFVADPRLSETGFKPLHREYPATSVAWYRKVFALPASDAGRRLSIEFDGVFRDCTVVLNGHLLGRNLGGYVPFAFDITDYATVGGDNVLVVHVDATEHEGWFYEGAGIYRHVWLVKTAPVHVPQWGTYVTAEVKGRAATLRIATEIANDAPSAVQCRVVSTVLDAAGRTVARADSMGPRLAPWERAEVRQQAQLADAALWSPETPVLYTLVTTLEVSGAVVERYETPFGVRHIRFDANEGFFLNGTRVEIKGTCNHQDHAGVGAALPDRLQYFRIGRLKEMGCNAYRTSHNPPTPELLDACDTLGMLVVDETRMFGSSAEALSQLERMMRRDRNRPSIIAWSIANEEPEQGTERGLRVATTMARLVRKLDPTRPVTAAMDSAFGEGVTKALDVQGFNYRAEKVDAFHTQRPDMPTWGTETGSTVSTRGIYANDPGRGYVSAYDKNAPWWASTAEAWYTIFGARKWIAGGFIWTGFDYRGEPTPYKWPCINSHFGVIDTCGFPKDLFYYYQAWWSDKPVLHLFPHWNWPGKEGKDVEVWCFGNVDRVELFLDGKSLGARDLRRPSHAMWQVPYAPGKLEARGSRGGKELLVQVRETTGPAARIVLSADRTAIGADGEDVSVITATVVDAAGRMVPDANHEITFTASGSGRLLGVGNGDPSSHESDRGPRRRAFNGLCAGIVQANKVPGALRVSAVAAGLSAGEIEIACKAADVRPSA